VLRIRRGEEVVSVGVSGSNILATDESDRFTQELLEARLHAELRRGSAPKASESDVARDWDLLQKVRGNSDGEVVVLRSNRGLQNGSAARAERAGNQP
jgi:hypothetical protein